MADEAPKTPNPFDLRTIKDLVGLMSRHDLSEIDLREGPMRIRLRRGAREITVSPPPVSSVPAPAAAAAPAVPAASANPAESDKSTRPAHLIKSPTPGTFYTAPDPKSEPFVRVGSRVTPTTVVCLIEAMKIFNEITADCTGIITEVLVENQQPVEFGQPLFRVELTG